MIFFLSSLAYLVLVTLPGVIGLHQIVHDTEFQPNYVLRVTQKEVSTACRARFTTLVNGSTIFRSVGLRAILWLYKRKITFGYC
jgi:hypothetical protein